MSEPHREWDPYAPEALADPPASWAELRERCPVALERADVRLLGRVARTTTSSRSREPRERFNNSGGPQFGTSRPPLEVDRPEHTFFRRVLQPHFAQRAGRRSSSPAVRGFVAEMLAPALAAGEADLAEALSYPLPARTLCLWLGLPDEEWSVPEGRLGEALRRRGGARRRPGDARAPATRSSTRTRAGSCASGSSEPRDPGST